jgi:hypothetical protein
MTKMYAKWTSPVGSPLELSVRVVVVIVVIVVIVVVVIFASFFRAVLTRVAQLAAGLVAQRDLARRPK